MKSDFTVGGQWCKKKVQKLGSHKKWTDSFSIEMPDSLFLCSTQKFATAASNFNLFGCRTWMMEGLSFGSRCAALSVQIEVAPIFASQAFNGSTAQLMVFHVHVHLARKSLVGVARRYHCQLIRFLLTTMCAVQAPWTYVRTYASVHWKRLSNHGTSP